ncbi:MAG: butyryl-CoA:acetate CoA-transferase [Verrucomicrobiales bacterium]|nr:butyryl-CoA:acetate CoA-transferase [Verrucomicrobiales bacterium]
MGSRSATRIAPEEAAALVKSGNWVDYGFGMGQPDVFDRALAARRDELVDVKIRAAFSMRPRAVLEPPPAPSAERILWLNWHFSKYDRRQHTEGLAHYIPMNFGEAPDLYRRFLDPVDVAVVKCCPCDARGFFNFSGACTYHAAILERARKVVIEVDPFLPYVHGPENGIHRSDVDFVMETDGSGPPEIANPPPSEVDLRMARHIAAEVEDGACLQIGIGGMPNAVCAALREAGRRNLGVHTEMLTDGLVDLHEAGLVTGALKRSSPGRMVFTFAAGSARQYRFIHENVAMETQPVDRTNLPHAIMANDRVVSVNSTTQVDLQGQAASESVGHRHISGTGGQLQFVRGAYASRGGKSFMCLPSTRLRKDGVVESRIVAELTPGNIVTTPRTDIMYVATEWGVVNLKGRSVPERVRALISIAHPDFREDLAKQARNRGWVPRQFL